MGFIQKILKFLTTDVWNIRIASLSERRSYVIKLLRVTLIAFQGLGKDRCSLKASALTYYSLLSIVPVLAIAFGIAKGFGFEALLHSQLLQNFSAQEEILEPIMDAALLFLNNTQGGLVAVIGVVLLLWIVINLLTHIEKSFNEIWNIRKTRSVGRKFSDYLSILLIGPVFITLSISATVYVAAQIEVSADASAMTEIISPLTTFSIKLLPYVIIWILFTFIYIFIPNTRINFKSAVIAGLIAGTVFQLVQWGYIEFQVGVAKYNAIYGSFAAIPLFIIWLQISWLIVLFGVEIAYAHQNVEAFEFAFDSYRVGARYKRLLSLRVVTLVCKQFGEGKDPLTSRQISNILEIPIRLVDNIIGDLEDAELINETQVSGGKSTAWQPSGDVHRYTILHVMDALDRSGVNDIHVLKDADYQVLSESLDGIYSLIKQAPDNRLLIDL